jgi:hypothetical protein
MISQEKSQAIQPTGLIREQILLPCCRGGWQSFGEYLVPKESGGNGGDRHGRPVSPEGSTDEGHFYRSGLSAKVR